MSRIDVLMPSMGESLAEGTLAKWFKKVGDAVKRDETIFEISTDKVDSEVQAVSAGVLAEILVNEGETVPVNAVVARIETDVNAAVSAPAPAPESGKRAGGQENRREFSGSQLHAAGRRSHDVSRAPGNPSGQDRGRGRAARFPRGATEDKVLATRQAYGG